MKTGLYERHVALGAKIVDFAGWEMPVQYSGVIKEHQAVRERVGLFDVSHMGRILINGPDAEKLLDYLSTNCVSEKDDWTATYTAWCDQSGGCVDDLIVYRQGPEMFFVIVNAGNRDKDLQHLKHAAVGLDVRIEEYYKDGILALQGPSAGTVMAEIFPEAKTVKPMRFLPVDYEGEEVILSRTGYTGAGGFELYGSTPSMTLLWDALMEAGRPYGILPIGLGARDTLRLEMGFPLYGHELSQDIAPTESVVSWTVKCDKKDFLGKEALDALERQGTKRSEWGIILNGKGIAREGYSVFKNGESIGQVTSGTLSPSLQKAIALILVDGSLEQGETIEIDIRGKQVEAVVVPLPFWRKES